MEVLMLVENGLELKSIKSQVQTIKIDNLNEALSNFASDGYAIAYLDYKVLIGRINNGSLDFYINENIEEKFIQRLRLFNEHRELFIWRTEEGLKGRLRIDEQGEEIYVIDARQVLWGTNKKELGNGWTKLFEERGTELILPFDGISLDNKKNRIFLKTRNYIDFYPETFQATYVDCRFTGFADKEKDLK